MKVNIQDAKTWQWLGFSAIAFFVLVVYAPSLMHVPRADQIMYLAEVAHKNTWWDLTIGCLDLNRHRQFNPGDELLFRPVDYFLLGTEKYFFGYDFFWWQAVGIALHLTVVWLLLRLLLTVCASTAAVGFAAFFSLLFVNMEMVAWHHINGYLIFVACLLAALRRFYIILQGGGTHKDYGWMTGVLLLAAFTHEMGSVAAAVLGTVLWFVRPADRKWILYLWAVPIVYAAASLLNAWLHPFTFTKSLPSVVPVGVSHRAQDWLLANGFWSYAGLFPGEFKWIFAARDMLDPSEINFFRPMHILAWPALLGAIVVYMYGWCRPRLRLFACTAFALAGIFSAIITAGRGSQIMMWDVLRVNTYYFYIFWIFAIVGLYASVDWASASVRSKRFLAICAAGLIVFNACKLYAANEEQARGNNEIQVLVKTMELLIREHGAEPGFSFYVDPQYPGNYIYKELKRWSEPLREYSFIEVLYPQYFTAQNPKYKFLARGTIANTPPRLQQ